MSHAHRVHGLRSTRFPEAARLLPFGPALGARSERLAARRPTGRTLALLAVIVVAAGGGLFALDRLPDVASLLATDRLATLLQSAGPIGPLLLIGGMIAAVVVSPIPSLPLDVAAGAAYGPIWGTIYVVIGAEIGAILSFLIARILGRELVHSLLRRDVRFCENCSDAHLAAALVLARLLPVVSFDIVSYGAGLTNVSLFTFAWTTLAGMIPPTVAFTYFGSSAASARWPLIAVGMVVVSVVLLAPKLVLRHPDAWWARLFLAARAASAAPAQVHQTPADTHFRRACP